MQEVLDDEGRQRLHGAFTGGFSAGWLTILNLTFWDLHRSRKLWNGKEPGLTQLLSPNRLRKR